MTAARIRQNQLATRCQRQCDFIKCRWLVGKLEWTLQPFLSGVGNPPRHLGGHGRRLWFSLLFDETGPVLLGFGEIPLSVLVEIVSDAFAVLEDQAAIHDLKGVHVNLDEFVPGDAIRTVATENRFVFGGFLIEEFFVFFRGKEVGSAVMLARELRSAFDGLMVGEERDRIVALDSDAGFVEVEKGLGLGQQWGGE